MECEFPNINSTDDEIVEIFRNTKTIAVVGLSSNKSKASYQVAKYLQDLGFEIVPIYPKEDVILGKKVYRSLGEVPFKIDMVDIFRKSDAIFSVVNEAINRKDVDVIWTQLGVVNNEAAQKAINAGIKVVQNKCTKIEYANLI